MEALLEVKLLSFVLLFIGLLLRTTHAAETHYYDFVLMEANFTKLCSTKSIITVNGSFPGPEIRVHKGDTVFVNVHNRGKYGVTIHWHGVAEPRNPWSDGPELITQCAIKPGDSFLQEVNFTTEEGTLWWHAHSDWTQATVHGAIIILPPEGASYPFPKPDEEHTIILSSWFKGNVMAIIEDALATGGEPNLSDAFTINGEPGDFYNCSKDTTFRLLVDYGKTYLLRVIGAVMNVELFFGIANHVLTVVGMDGAYLKPFTTDYIIITPGQTMDLLITANQTQSLYYMAGSPFSDATAPFDNTTTTAILQYRGNYTPPIEPSFPSLPTYNDSDAVLNYTKSLRSLASRDHPINVPKNITKRIFVTISVNTISCENASCSGPDGDRFAASLNNISFQSPKISILQAYYSGANGVYNATFPDEPPYFFNFTGDVSNISLSPSLETAVKMINYGEEVEIIFQGTNLLDGENHPMHQHGYSFYVVGMGKGNFNEMTDPESYNLIDPPLVNTIGVPTNGWTTIRFLADNPGVWLQHCHLDRHLSWGMNTVLIVKNGPTDATSMRPPPSYMPPCS